jgi:hypothetical protein
MSLIEHAITANRKSAERHDPSLANKPAPKIAILTCMDPRLNQLLEWFDIKPADADVIRNVRRCALSDVLNSRSEGARNHDRRTHRLRNDIILGRRVRKPPPHPMRRVGSISR